MRDVVLVKEGPMTSLKRWQTIASAATLVGSLFVGSLAYAQGDCDYELENPTVEFLQPAPDSSYVVGTEVSTPGAVVVAGPLTIRIRASDDQGVVDVTVNDQNPGTGLNQGYEAVQDPDDPSVWEVEWAPPSRFPGLHILQAFAADCNSNVGVSLPLDVLAF